MGYWRKLKSMDYCNAIVKRTRVLLNFKGLLMVGKVYTKLFTVVFAILNAMKAKCVDQGAFIT